jgi:hypothetical protein
VEHKETTAQTHHLVQYLLQLVAVAVVMEYPQKPQEILVGLAVVLGAVILVVLLEELERQAKDMLVDSHLPTPVMQTGLVAVAQVLLDQMGHLDHQERVALVELGLHQALAEAVFTMLEVVAVDVVAHLTLAAMVVVVLVAQI